MTSSSGSTRADQIHVAGLVGFYRHVQDLVDGFDEVIQLVLCLLGEGQALVVDLLGHAHQVHSVVAQTLEVAHRVEHLGDDVGVILGQRLGGELDQVGAQAVFKGVDLFLRLQHQQLIAVTVVGELLHCQQDVLPCQLQHLVGLVVALLDGNRRGAQQAFVQEGHGSQSPALCSVLLVLGHPFGQLETGTC